MATCLIAIGPARARAADDPVSAEALFQLGQEAAQRRDWVVACGKFRESLALEYAVGTVLNLADCEEQRGRITTAWQLYTEALGKLRKPDDTRRLFAQQRVHELEGRMPRLRITLRASEPGAQVARDGKRVGMASLGEYLPVDPGKHVVTVTAPNRKTAEYSVVVRERERANLDVQLGAAPPPPPLEEPVGWTMIGLGAAGVVVGSIFGGLAVDRAGTVKVHCHPDTYECDQEGVDAADEGSSFARASTLSIGIGISAAAAGVLLLLLGSEPAQGDETSVAFRF